jgi:hypothetical protein
MTFIAAFGGQPCGTCDERICEGQEVEYDLSNRLVHVICPETLDSRPEGDICDGCNLTLPMSGVCGYC